MKLFRRNKQVEFEIESSFKLLEYLAELYQATKGKLRQSHCLRLIDQVRLINDQVIPLIEDELCEGIVILQLSTVCKRAQLRRKEAFYKNLAFMRMKGARTQQSLEMANAIFAKSLDSLYQINSSQIVKGFQKRSNAGSFLVKDMTARYDDEI